MFREEDMKELHDILKYQLPRTMKLKKETPNLKDILTRFTEKKIS